MKKNYFIILMMLAALPMFSLRVNATLIQIPLQVEYDDPSHDQDNPNRGPVLIPEVSIDEYTLYFDSSCENCILRLVDEEDEVVYTTVISSGSLVLPSNLSGDYELQIIRDNWCFYGYIEL